MKSDFIIALTQLAAERNLPRGTVISAIEAALASAYKKDSISTGQNISVNLDPKYLPKKPAINAPKSGKNTIAKSIN